MRKWMNFLPEKSRLVKILVVAIAVSGVVSAIVTILFTVFGFKMVKKSADAGANVLNQLNRVPTDEKWESLEARLVELERLYARGLITTIEFEAKRREILEEL